MLCPEYKDRVLLKGKGRAMCTSCASTGIGGESIRVRDKNSAMLPCTAYRRAAVFRS
jgi:hypothetical protein